MKKLSTLLIIALVFVSCKTNKSTTRATTTVKTETKKTVSIANPEKGENLQKKESIPSLDVKSISVEHSKNAAKITNRKERLVPNK